MTTRKEAFRLVEEAVEEYGAALECWTREKVKDVLYELRAIQYEWWKYEGEKFMHLRPLVLALHFEVYLETLVVVYRFRAPPEDLYKDD